MNKILLWVKNLIIPLALGGIVGFIISGFIDYDTLIQPPLAPPSIAFPIVWSILYLLMGISYSILDVNSLVCNRVNRSYYIQLIVNLLWSIIFFVLKWRFVSILWILLLISLVINMIVIFYNKNKLSGLLQIPYLIWIIFATYLNIGIYLLN